MKKILAIVLIVSVCFFFLADTFAFLDRHAALFQAMNFVVPVTETHPRLLNALVHVESSNNPRAINRFSGARGLTQITPIAWKELKKHYKYRYGKLKFRQAMLNHDIARQAGKDYLYILQQHLKARKIPPTLDNLLAAYVWGEGRLAQYGLTRAPRVVKRYIANIKKLNQIPD